VATNLKRVPNHWQGALLVCGKCTKKIDGGFGKKGRTPLAKLLRKILGLKTGRKARLGIVETRCLGLCPRGAVAMVDARAPVEWLVVRQGSDVAELAARLDRRAEPTSLVPVIPGQAGIRIR